MEDSTPPTPQSSFDIFEENFRKSSGRLSAYGVLTPLTTRLTSLSTSLCLSLPTTSAPPPSVRTLSDLRYAVRRYSLRTLPEDVYLRDLPILRITGQNLAKFAKKNFEESEKNYEEVSDEEEESGDEERDMERERRKGRGSRSKSGEREREREVGKSGSSKRRKRDSEESVSLSAGRKKRKVDSRYMTPPKDSADDNGEETYTHAERERERGREREKEREEKRSKSAGEKEGRKKNPLSRKGKATKATGSPTPHAKRGEKGVSTTKSPEKGVEKKRGRPRRRECLEEVLRGTEITEMGVTVDALGKYTMKGETALMGSRTRRFTEKAEQVIAHIYITEHPTIRSLREVIQYRFRLNQPPSLSTIHAILKRQNVMISDAGGDNISVSSIGSTSTTSKSTPKHSSNYYTNKSPSSKTKRNSYSSSKSVTHSSGGVKRSAAKPKSTPPSSMFSMPPPPPGGSPSRPLPLAVDRSNASVASVNHESPNPSSSYNSSNYNSNNYNSSNYNSASYNSTGGVPRGIPPVPTFSVSRTPERERKAEGETGEREREREPKESGGESLFSTPPKGKAAGNKDTSVFDYNSDSTIPDA